MTQRLGTALLGRWKRGKALVAARVADISVNGMFFETDQAIAPGLVMDLVVDLPSGPISFLGVARQCGATRRGRGIGVSIFSMEPKDRARWNRHYGDALIHDSREICLPVL